MARSGEGDHCLLPLAHLRESLRGRHSRYLGKGKESFELCLAHFLSLGLALNLRQFDNWKLNVILDLDAVGQGNEGEGCE